MSADDKSGALKLARELIEWAETYGPGYPPNGAFEEQLRSVRDNTIVVCKALLAESHVTTIAPEERALTDAEICEAWNSAGADRPEAGAVDLYLHYMRAIAKAQRAKMLATPSATGRRERLAESFRTLLGPICPDDEKLMRLLELAEIIGSGLAVAGSAGTERDAFDVLVRGFRDGFTYTVGGKPHRICNCDPHKGPCLRGNERKLLTTELSRCLIPDGSYSFSTTDGETKNG